MTSWKRDFASGLIVLAPLLVTLYVIYWLFGVISRFALLATNVDDPVVAVALTLLVFVLLVFSVGYMMRTAVGGIVEGVIDNLINRLPILRVVYNASKMAVETVLSGGTDEFQKPVKIEPWEGMRLTAFKTGKTTQDGREVVFMPTAPNITTGFVIELDPADVEDSDESVEDALTRVLSAGFGENENATASITELIGDDTEDADATDTDADDGDADSDTDVNTDANTDSGTDADTNVNTDANTDSDTDVNTDANTNPGSSDET